MYFSMKGVRVGWFQATLPPHFKNRAIEARGTATVFGQYSGIILDIFIYLANKVVLKA